MIIPKVTLPIGQMNSQKFQATHFKKYTTARNTSIQPSFASKFVEKKSFI